jgi:hypothetical protein
MSASSPTAQNRGKKTLPCIPAHQGLSNSTKCAIKRGMGKTNKQISVMSNRNWYMGDFFGGILCTAIYRPF